MRRLGTISGLAGALALAACASLPVSTSAQALYAAVSAYEFAEQQAADYAQKPTANGALVIAMADANDKPEVKTAVAYGRAFAACQGKPVGTSVTPQGVPVDCTAFNFSANSVLQYAAVIDSVVQVLLQAKLGGAK